MNVASEYSSEGEGRVPLQFSRFRLLESSDGERDFIYEAIIVELSCPWSGKGSAVLTRDDHRENEEKECCLTINNITVNNITLYYTVTLYTIH